MKYFLQFSERDDVYEPYEPILPTAPPLYTVNGEWQKSPLRRRMTIIVLSSGELVLHSPIRMKSKDLHALEKLGRIHFIIMPNTFHGSDVPWYAKRYPDAQVFVPGKVISKLEQKIRISGSLEKDWPKNLQGELDCFPIEGTRMHESAFFHHSSETLILTDLVFNMGDVFKGLEKKFMKWNQITNQFGPSRIFRLFFLKDRNAFEKALKKVCECDFKRIIMNHGIILEKEAKARMKEVFRPLIQDLF